MAVLIGIELIFAGPVPLPFPTTSAEISPVFFEAAGKEGRLLVLPVGGPGLHPQRALYEQRAHARDLALRPNVPGPVLGIDRNPTGKWLCSLGQPGRLKAPDIPDVSAFLKANITTILVREQWVTEVMEVLGDPDLRAEGGAIWELTRLSLEPGGAI